MPVKESRAQVVLLPALVWLKGGKGSHSAVFIVVTKTEDDCTRLFKPQVTGKEQDHVVAHAFPEAKDDDGQQRVL